MQFKSYWHDSAPTFLNGTPGPVEGKFDVAVIGGGFTGLSAALEFAANGVRVVVLEAGRVGSGASGRNGGHVNNGLAHGFLGAQARLGIDRAKALYHAYDAAVDAVERIVTTEKIDCSFRRGGKLKLASKANHFEAIARNFEAINKDVDAETRLLSKDELNVEIGSGAFFGGMLFKKSAMMHMGKFVAGLADAAARHGAVIYENAAVTGRRHTSHGHQLSTTRGTVVADTVFVATGAYTTTTFEYFRSRIIPVGSYIIATRPLNASEAQLVMPGDRTCVTSKHIGNYFRLSPDNRLIFGGRAKFSARSDPGTDARCGQVLRQNLTDTFPQLAGVEVDYCWGGLVDMTKDRFPRAGFTDNAWYAMGYSGHGAQMSVHMGVTMAKVILGKPAENPLSDMSWERIPSYIGKPWFLPLVGLYYSTLDRLR